MVQTKIMELLNSQIGKEITKSPSQIAIWLKGILLEVGEGFLKVEFTVRKDMTNPLGALHGGMYALIIDEVIGATVYALNTTNIFVSVNLNVDYLSAAHLGEKIIAESKIVRQGKTIINGECRIYNEKGEIIAKGSSNLMGINSPKVV